jgi:1,2-diacylglycerol 3-beta-galactosyltransferase
LKAKKKILILTADAGFGHRSAAKAVAAALQELFGDECEAPVINPLDDKRLPEFVRTQQSDYDRVVREMPDLYKFGFQATNLPVPTAIYETVLTVLLFETMRDLVRQEEPDAILITYPGYQAPLEAVFTTRERYTPLLVVVTDLGQVHRLWFHRSADMCLVATEKVRETAIQAGLQPEKIKITGIPANPQLAKENRAPAEIRAGLGWRTDLTTLLAVGSKRVVHLPDALKVLNHSGHPVQLALVAGGDEDLYHSFQSTEWHLPVYIYNFVDHLPLMIRAADCVMSKAGGLIVTESLACGRPMLLTDVIPGQETGNAEYIVEGGAGDLVGEPVEALEILCHWLERDGALLAQRTENARCLGRPRAAHEVADLLWAAAQHGPYTRVGRDSSGRAELISMLNQHGVIWNET